MDHDKIAKKEIIKCGVKDFHFKKLAFSIYILRKIKKLFNIPTFSLYTPKETFKKLFKGARFLFISPPPPTPQKKKINIFKN